MGRISPKQAEQASSDSEQLAKIRRKRPQISDLQAEGVIGHVPVQNPDGSQTFKVVNDHAAVKRALEMDQDYKKAMADFHEEGSYRPERQEVAEQMKERANRRRGRRRTYFFFGSAR